MTYKSSDSNAKLMDFSFVGDQHLSIDEMLHIAYLEGQKDFKKDIIKMIENNLQTSAGFSSLFLKKLEEKSIEVKDMFLRILDFTEFECLVLMSDKDYYTKDKRWEAYNISRNLNESIDNINIKFSLMPYSDELKSDTIASEGFYFKYDSK